LLLTDDLRVKIADFGLSLPTEDELPAASTPSLAASSSPSIDDDLAASASAGDSDDDDTARRRRRRRRLLRRKQRERSTKQHRRVGTLVYMPPEVLAFSAYTTKGDVYSYGLVLWELFTEQRCFDGISLFRVAHLVQHEGLRPSTDHRLLTHRIIELLTHCWQHEPSERLTFNQVSAILDQFSAADVSI
jgi:serine/threonine protein kinase